LLIVWAAFVYQFGVVLLFLVLYLAVFARDFQIVRDRVLLAASGAAFVCFVGWFALLATSPQLLVVQVPLMLFDFPAFYKYLLRWLVRGWPIITAGLFIGSVWLFVRFLMDKHDAEAFFLLGALYVPALSASLFESSFVPVYTLHLYPLIALIFAMVAWKTGALASSYISRREPLSKRLALAISILLVFLSQDVSPSTAWSISERTYQSEKPLIRNATTFRFYSDFHQDTEGPSLFVKEHMNEGDVVVAIGTNFTMQLFHYYIGNVDYVLASQSKAEEWGLVKQQHLIHYTNGSEFITELSELRKLVRKHRGSLWMLGDYRILREDNPYHTDEAVKAFVRELAARPEHTGRDGFTFALKVTQN